MKVRNFDELADRVRSEPGAEEEIAAERARAVAEILGHVLAELRNAIGVTQLVYRDGDLMFAALCGAADGAVIAGCLVGMANCPVCLASVVRGG